HPLLPPFPTRRSSDLSIGIAMFPADGTSVETLLANADAAMYCAKQRGRNNLQCYAAGMNSVTQEKVKLESDLHEALALRQFELRSEEHTSELQSRFDL